jgi:hypothetical protein
MPDNKIEVEYLTTVAGALQAIEKINRRLDQQENKLQKVGDTSKKSVDSAIGSFTRLEQTLKENEAALKGMAAGTSEFDQQLTKVQQLRAEHAKLKQILMGESGAVQQVAGSFDKLERELKDNESALKKLVIGSKAFSEQKRKVDDLRKSLAGAKKDIGESGEKTGGMLSGAVGKVGAMAAGMLSVQTIAALLVDELEHVKNLRMDAAGNARGVEGSIADMAINIGAENVTQARGMIEQNAPELGVTQEGLAKLLAAGISGGAKDLEESLKLSALTLKLTAGDANKAQPIMSGMLSLAATTGNRDFESVAGQLSQFQKAARGEDLAVSINNMSTAMAAANTPGERVAALGGERTLEMSSVMSQILQDPKMAVTGTALRQMVQKMDAFTPKTSATLDDGTTSKLSKESVEEFKKLGTVDERMQAMRDNPELRNQFLSTIENSEGKVAIRELVTGSDKVKALEATAAQTITPSAQAGQEYTKLVAVIDENTQILQAQNKNQAMLQVADTTGPRALEGQAQQIVQDTIAKMDLSGMQGETGKKIEWGMEANIALGKSVPEAGIAALEESKQTRKLFGVVPMGGAVSDEDKARADAAIEALQKIQQLMEGQANKPPIKVTQPVSRPKASPLPAATAP